MRAAETWHHRPSDPFILHEFQKAAGSVPVHSSTTRPLTFSLVVGVYFHLNRGIQGKHVGRIPCCELRQHSVFWVRMPLLHKPSVRYRDKLASNHPVGSTRMDLPGWAAWVMCGAGCLVFGEA
ncbi:hypothetical protein BO79DRAFT_289452 [Aspergillus costaricaensis CBS 115574]|uniref:Uncharacterized protein n=1 Tax=Aspergillus costaricaensis CBS 115574 TaxID=1448317 RepID=A0ACD1I5Z7_9EURO|nr:hypothetical protein BO79DRAFT_289452 [Aspergillus costaricaensis CBS 115574]RAK85913.1 hypothetical protein BO79DRAFT_289452 [Aspergillus costaricaensis CBS 115574]